MFHFAGMKKIIKQLLIQQNYYTTVYYNAQHHYDQPVKQATSTTPPVLGDTLDKCQTLGVVGEKKSLQRREEKLDDDDG
jgi:hypothetical protein